MTFHRESISPATWPAIHELLAPAIAHGGDTDVLELIDQLLSDHAQLWVSRVAGMPVAAAVTTIHHDNSLNCQLLGGRGMHAWMDDLIATVALKARPLGIERFEQTGRKGWVRFLGSRGWRVVERRDGKFVMELVL